MVTTAGALDALDDRNADVRAAGGSAADVLKCYAPPKGPQSR